MADFQNILDQLKENNKGSEKASADLSATLLTKYNMSGQTAKKPGED